MADVIPIARRYPWEAGVTSGVIGGIPHRTNLVDITQAPYHAAGNLNESTGNISSGTPTLAVTSNTGFAQGNPIRVGFKAIQQVVVTAGATATGDILVRLYDSESSPTDNTVAVVAGDTATEVAGKLRSATYLRWDASGSGTTVIFTRRDFTVVALGSFFSAPAGVAGNWSATRAGLLVVASRIQSIVGSTWTLATNSPSNATGANIVHADDVALRDAVAAAQPGDVLYIPAGSYRWEATVNTQVGVSYKNNITIRGAGTGELDGEGLTLIDSHVPNGSVIVLGGQINSATVSYPPGHPSYASYPNRPITGSPVKGDTVLTIGETASITAYPETSGRIGFIHVKNDNTLPVVGVGGYEYVRGWPVICAFFSGNTVTLAAPLPFDLPASLSPFFNMFSYQPENVGLEDIKIDCANSPAVEGAAGVQECKNCWLRNVAVFNSRNYSMGIGASVNCEIRHSRIQAKQLKGTNGAGLLLGASANCLIEDNNFDDLFPLVEMNAGCTGMVFGYNNLTRCEVFGVIGGALNSNHGGHNSFNLCEGNIAQRYQSDGYHGSEGFMTLHRNFFHGTGVSTVNRYGITMNRFSRGFNIIANLLGRNDGAFAGLTWKYMNVGPEFAGNSSTTVTISPSLIGMIGPNAIVTTFTVTAGMAFAAAGLGIVHLYSAANPDNWIQGRVWTYSGMTMGVIVDRIGGSGTHSDWIITGGQGYGGDENYCMVLGGPNIGNGGHNQHWIAPSLGKWWPVWDGKAPIRRGAYNAGTAYNLTGSAADVVDYYAPGPGGLTTGDITQWIAKNPAKHGLATWDTPGPASADWHPFSQNSFQEIDGDVWRTSIVKGNWNARDNGIHASEGLAGATHPESYYRPGGAPAWFGTMTFPPFDPTDPNQSDVAIPAGYRAANGTEAPGYNDGSSQVATPSFTPAAGTYTSAQSVAMACATSGAQIYYTTDGSTPTVFSTAYTGPVSVAATTTLKAFAFKSGLTDSAVRTGVYTIDEPPPPQEGLNFPNSPAAGQVYSAGLRTWKFNGTGWARS